MGEILESGVEESAASIEGLPESVAHTCHDILNALAALSINLNYLAQDAKGEKLAAADDARQSLERLIGLAKTLRQSAEQVKAA